MTENPSKSRVNKAGKRIRAAIRGDDVLAPEDWNTELDVLRAHRAAHRQPMVTANVSLRKFCERQGLAAVITQRLKRMDTILDKLRREPTLSLGGMQDIGGVRVVLPSIDEVRLVTAWLLKNHPQSRVSDYIERPRSSGYRAIHVVTEWGGQTRKPVEIQLRSEVMHNWANMVEEMSGLLGENYKHDRNSLFNSWALAASRIMEAQELGQPVSPEMLFALLHSREQLQSAYEDRWKG